jgi:uncharacterized protein (TIGR01244 family)
MEFRPVTEDYAVSGQIAPTDIEAIKEAGFRSIVCHRPDDEQPGQPSAAAVGEAAAKAGLGFRHIPIRSGEQVPEEAVAAMRKALDELDGPVFAYCRSGARSTNIFSMAAYG